jgi:hypothetical protein
MSFSTDATMDALSAPKANVLRADLCLVDEKIRAGVTLKRAKAKTSIGRGGTNFASKTTLIHSYAAGKTLSRSSKSSDIAIETEDLPPARSPSELKQWRTHYVRSARRSSGWGLRMSKMTSMETLTSEYNVKSGPLSVRIPPPNRVKPITISIIAFILA